ncbi:helix-turn-helix domain-containing protein [Streptomyces sp. Je 1-4]|uniref:helix-turn-helix domain-containing protein n=1 Tax=Streptomyces TaxID=1883 RepID=UPI0021D9EB73|nr:MULTISPECIES: helix-turn-helix domain-containing protein [unclassified Streptomyces]UYB37996.1 helix-turn-helix domain-containing protein [Streptomyces sp. Je 1-4]UZQ33926.1 helix-turn-helix domain-containing protein [Streptomyces sp. Je 1-4] [Streptomyces sp. Je 1-4 4N24]UZQ41344.1 helix-turn-helix domain-containing protein [Streptomyces sp. Je 1-4] [Streptomyces sp. Je 1-4 4N24_ara]
MTLRIDISGLPSERLRFAASPLAELTAMLHVLTEPGHHPQFAGWAGDVRSGLRPELSERLREAEFLWRSSQADFLIPARPRATLAEELDDVDRIDDETYVTAALVTTCGSNRVHFAAPSPLTDAAARERALDLAQARGARQEAFTERLLADPAAVRARVRHTLEQCAEAFFDAAWAGVAVQLATDLRLKSDLLKHQGIGAALASVSGAVTLAPDGDCIIVDKLQDKATAAHGTGVTFIPSVFGSPHLVVVHAPGWQPVVQYPVAEQSPSEPVSLETVTLRLEALAHPVRLRLLRTLARGPHTTGELAHAWELSPPEVSRHLAVLRRAGLLTARRHGRYVRHTLNLPDLTALGTDLLAAVLR